MLARRLLIKSNFKSLVRYCHIKDFKDVEVSIKEINVKITSLDNKIKTLERNPGISDKHLEMKLKFAGQALVWTGSIILILGLLGFKTLFKTHLNTQIINHACKCYKITWW